MLTKKNNKIKHRKKNSQCRRILLSMICCVVLIYSVPFHASAMNVFHDLNERPLQAKSNWCWAAVAEALGKQELESSTLTQYDVVQTFKGISWLNQYPNVPGTVYDARNGAEYVTGYNYSFDIYGAYAFVTVKYQLNQGRVIGVTLDNQYGGIGHDIIIVGYYDANVVVRIYDPADSFYHDIVFSALQNGGYVSNCVYTNSIVCMN